MNITVNVDSAEWEAALDELLMECRAAGRDASVEAANAIQERTKELLTDRWHPPFTATPSGPGEPPAAITGQLAESVVVDESDPDYVQVGPTTDYSREQELGGPMRGHPFMHWFEDGAWHRSREHSLPDRPYLRPATEELIDDGTVEDAYYRHWADAIALVTGA